MIINIIKVIWKKIKIKMKKKDKNKANYLSIIKERFVISQILMSIKNMKIN